MDFTLSQEQKNIISTAKSFAKKEMAPFAAEWDEKSFFPVEVLKKAAKLGFSSIYVKEKNGGCGLSRLDAALVFEELSTACVSTAAYLSIHNMVSSIIDTYGNKEQHQQWLPQMISMESLGSYCLTEPNAGSDAASLKTKARREGNYYILDGTKNFISGGGVSDIYICMVRTGEEGPKGITCFVVEKGTPGLSFGKKEKKMGWKSQPTTTVNFENCKVPLTHRLGEEGDGFKIAMKALDGGRVNIAACSLGAARHCLDAAKTYMGERKQFGKKLADFEGLQFRLADMATDLEAARLLTHKAALSLDKGDPEATQYCSMAKRYATDAGYQICNEALQLHGGYGYMSDYGIERFVRDVRVHQILEGTNEIMRLIIAKSILKK